MYLVDMVYNCTALATKRCLITEVNYSLLFNLVNVVIHKLCSAKIDHLHLVRFHTSQTVYAQFFSISNCKLAGLQLSLSTI